MIASAIASSSSPSWGALPAELRLAVVDRLPLSDVRALALASRAAHKLCLPALFRNVSIQSLEDLRSYITDMPADRTRHVHTLAVSTKPTGCDAWTLPDDDCATAELVALLAMCESLQTLALNLFGCPLPDVIPSLARLAQLRTLSITNAAPEEHVALSERFAVAAAFAVPRLGTLTLAGISRSASQVPDEVIGFFPLAYDDEAFELPPTAALDVPSTSTATALEPRLPTLLALPHLHTLALRDTHLGDAAWAHAPLRAPLHTLELGACAHDAGSDDAESYSARILSNPALAACPSLHTIGLGAPLAPSPSPTTATPTTPRARRPDARFAALTRLRIEPHFPLAGPPDDAEDSPLARTLDALSGSPLASVDVRCFADDVPDVCAGLAAALVRRRARGRASSLSSVVSADEVLTPASAAGERVHVVSPEDDDEAHSDYLARLAHVGVHVVPDDLLAGDAAAECEPPALDDASDALRRLRAACGKVRLAGVLTAALSAAAEARRCTREAGAALEAPAGKALVVL